MKHNYFYRGLLCAFLLCSSTGYTAAAGADDPAAASATPSARLPVPFADAILDGVTTLSNINSGLPKKANDINQFLASWVEGTVPFTHQDIRGFLLSAEGFKDTFRKSLDTRGFPDFNQPLFARQTAENVAVFLTPAAARTALLKDTGTVFLLGGATGNPHTTHLMVELQDPTSKESKEVSKKSQFKTAPTEDAPFFNYKGNEWVGAISAPLYEEATSDHKKHVLYLKDGEGNLKAVTLQNPTTGIPLQFGVNPKDRTRHEMAFIHDADSGATTPRSRGSSFSFRRRSSSMGVTPVKPQNGGSPAKGKPPAKPNFESEV